MRTNHDITIKYAYSSSAVILESKNTNGLDILVSLCNDDRNNDEYIKTLFEM